MKKLSIFVLVVPAVSLLVLRLAAVLFGYTSTAAFAGGHGPLTVVLILGGAFALTSYVLGLVTGDLSWVDRMWSTVPVLYAWIYARSGSYATGTTVAAVLISLWGVRLTFNFARRGGYTSMEDYRWGVLNSRIKSRVIWQLFSFGFISVYQNCLFVLFTLPVYALYLAPGGNPGIVFWSAGAAFVLFLWVETAADQQQWGFQNARLKSGSPGYVVPAKYADDVRRGFRTTGLFRFSRHPNYFGEIMIWWTVYVMAAAAVGTTFHWSIAGAVLLTLLFVGSTIFTESITRGKYPEYDRYRASTSPIVPLPPRMTDRRAEDPRTA